MLLKLVKREYPNELHARLMVDVMYAAVITL